LHVWDPFCGSGSFLIELLMMILDRPCRTTTESMPFENWPIHNSAEFDAFKREIEDFESARKRDDIDIWVIGSDISLKAIDACEKNIEHAEVQKFYDHGLLSAPLRPKIADPLTMQSHWPKPSVEGAQNLAAREVTIANSTQLDSFLSLYHGSFDKIGHKLGQLTNGFEDFSIITNVPYGEQSQEQ